MSIRAYFDGGVFPKNPGGFMAYAVIIWKDDYILHRYSKLYQPNPTNSNNLSEYLSFRHILQYLINNHLQDEPIIIYGDSQLVIEQMWGSWKIGEGSYIREALHCKSLLPRFSKISGKWISSDRNKITHKMIEEEIKKIRKEANTQISGNAWRDDLTHT
jgi:ribonuclease HI